MTRAVIMDANAFKVVYNDLIDDADGLGSAVIATIFREDYISVDMGGIIIQQWKDCSCGEEDEFFQEWVTNRITEDKIRKRQPAKEAQIKKKLRIELGVPAKYWVYLLLAIGIAAFMIVSQDIDFYEPRAKSWDAKKRAGIISNRAGCVCKHMLKYHKVTICALEQAIAILAESAA
jgi:hypothetical protein